MQISPTILSYEDARLALKNFYGNALICRIFNEILLYISLFSCFECIFQTYLTPSSSLSNIFTLLEKVASILFAADWLINFFIADHTIVFLKRSVSLSLFDDISIC